MLETKEAAQQTSFTTESKSMGLVKISKWNVSSINITVRKVVKS